jgi:predicted  nucleic acid-binding Zn-ribbon protein
MVDSRISKKASDIENVKNNEELTLTKKEFDEIDDKLKLLDKRYRELENERKRMEDSIGTHDEKIKRDEQKLFSGTITDAKELVNLQEEVKILKKSNDGIENQMLELMIKIDDLLEEIKNIQEKKEELESQINSMEKDIGRQVKLLEEKIKDLKATRDTVASGISGDYLDEYEKTNAKKKGIVVGVLRDRFCSACNMQIPIVEAEKIKDLDKVYKCPLCGKMLIIYRDEIEEIISELET